MNKKLTMQAIELTRQFLEAFHHKDASVVLSLCTSDVSWIGAQEEQYDIGYEAFEKDILSVTKDMFSCHLKQQEFMIAQNLGNVCTVIGKYIVESDDTESAIVAGGQRCVVVWEKIEGELKIRHLSTFSPLDIWKVKEGEHFITSMGELTKTFVDKRVNSMLNDKTISVSDDNATVHFVKWSEIIWIEAYGRKCIVRTLDKIINAKISITEIKKQLNSHFIKIHRSYIVNVYYVKSIKPYNVVMSDNTVINIPQKRYTDIKEELMGKLK